MSTTSKHGVPADFPAAVAFPFVHRRTLAYHPTPFHKRVHAAVDPPGLSDSQRASDGSARAGPFEDALAVSDVPAPLAGVPSGPAQGQERPSQGLCRGGGRAIYQIRNLVLKK